MLFEEFAKLLINAGREKNAFIEAMLNCFPSDQVITADNVKELMAAIYLCQGRISVPYRKPSSIKLNQRKVIAQFQNVQSQGVQKKILTEIYGSLKETSPQIERWLNGYGEMPAQIKQLVMQMESADEWRCLAKILTTPYKDEWLITFLTRRNSAGIGSEKTIEKVYQTVLPDLGLIAQLLWERGIVDVSSCSPKPGLPLKPEQIVWLESLEKALDLACSFRGDRCYVQPKYDGWQIQVHKDGDRIWLFDRTQKDLTDRLPDVVEACRTQLASESIRSTILDGEVIGFDPKTNELLPLEKTLLTPKHRCLVFDILLLNGEDYRKHKYQDRRLQLTNLLPVGGTTTIFVVEEVTVTTLEQLKDVYSKWIKDRRFEGVIVKDRNKPYSERGKSNGKWKVKNYLSLDLVVLGYTLPKTGAKDYPHLYAGAWNKNQEQLVMVADDIRSIKIPKTDREKLLKRLKKLVIKDKPALVAPDVVPRIWVKPEIIIEVTTNGLRVRDERFHHADNSKLYHKGIIDFRERNDKELEDANSLDEFRKLQFAPGHT